LAQVLSSGAGGGSITGIKRHEPEEIVNKLRQVEALVCQGLARIDAIREVSITEQTYYRWRKHYGSMGADQFGGRATMFNWSQKQPAQYLRYGQGGKLTRIGPTVEIIAVSGLKSSSDVNRAKSRPR